MGIDHFQEKRTPWSEFFFIKALFAFGALLAWQWLMRLLFLGLVGNPELWWETQSHAWRMDASMASYWFALGLLALLLPGKARMWGLRLGLFALISSGLLLAVSDAEFWVLWGSRFNAQTLHYLAYPRECLASLNLGQMTGIALLMLISALGAYTISARMSLGNSTPWIPWGLSLIMAFFLARGGFSPTPLQPSSVYYSTHPLRNAAATNGTWNFFFILSQQRYKPQLQAWKGEPEAQFYFQQDSGASPIWVQANRPHVFLFILESFTAQFSQVFSDGRGLRNGKSEMPFLDELALQGLRFSKTYACGDRTDKGLAAILAGYPGQIWQSLLNEPERFRHHRGLPRVFKDHGYRTHFYYGGDGEFSNTAAFAQAMGLDSIHDESTFSTLFKRDKWGLVDADVLQSLGSSMGRVQDANPQFITWLSLSSHEPYRVAELDPGFSSSWDQMDRYRASVRYTDACLRSFFTQFQKAAWFQQSLFIFMADHGRDIETGYTYVGEPSFFQIPFFVWGPALKEEFKHQETRGVFSQADLPNTLLAGMGWEMLHNPYSRNALKSGFPHVAIWHTEGRMGLMDSGSFVQGQIEMAPTMPQQRLRGIENDLWNRIESGKW